MPLTLHHWTNKSDAGNGAYGRCRVIDALPPVLPKSQSCRVSTSRDGNSATLSARGETAKKPNTPARSQSLREYGQRSDPSDRDHLTAMQRSILPNRRGLGLATKGDVIVRLNVVEPALDVLAVG